MSDGSWAYVDKIEEPHQEDTYQVFSQRQMKGVLLTRTEAIDVAIKLLVAAGVTATAIKEPTCTKAQ